MKLKIKSLKFYINRVNQSGKFDLFYRAHFFFYPYLVFVCGYFLTAFYNLGFLALDDCVLFPNTEISFLIIDDYLAVSSSLYLMIYFMIDGVSWNVS